MSFISDLKTLLTSDTSTNNFATGGIKEHLPVNYDITKNWVTYSYVETENLNTLDYNDIGASYVVDVLFISPIIGSIQTLTPTFHNYLINYRDDHIKDISLVEAEEIYIDVERELYYQTIRYEVLYLN